MVASFSSGATFLDVTYSSPLSYGAVGDGVTDSTTAFQNWITALQTNRWTGYIPPGVYLISSPLPLITVPIRIIGAGVYQSILLVATTFTGDLFSISETWNQQNYSTSAGVTLPQFSGTTFESFSIMGNVTATTQQNGFVFYDRNDKVLIQDVHGYNLTGNFISCAAHTKQQSVAFMRESYFHNIRANVCGGTNSAAVLEINTIGTTVGQDGTNEIRIRNLNIYAPSGIGILVRCASTIQNTRLIYFDQTRVEGLQNGSIAVDLVQIGDSTLSGVVQNVYARGLELINCYTNQNALTVTGKSAALQTYQCVFEGLIGGGSPNGSGINCVAGRLITFKMNGINTSGTNVVVAQAGPTGGNGRVLFDGYGQESSWTYNIDSSMISNVHFPISQVGNPSLSPVSVLGGSTGPVGFASAPVGSIYLNTSGATGSTLYVKEAGAGTTGWTAK